MSELEQLKKEMRELERRIKLLSSGAITNEKVKLDRFGFPSKYQENKWAVFFQYDYTANVGRYPGRPEKRSKWNPLFSGDSPKEVIDKIPEAIRALTELYEQAKGEAHDEDS